MHTTRPPWSPIMRAGLLPKHVYMPIETHSAQVHGDAVTVEWESPRLGMDSYQ